MKFVIFVFLLFIEFRYISGGAIPHKTRDNADNDHDMHPGDRFLPPKPKDFDFKRPNEDKNEFWLTEAMSHVVQQIKKERNFGKAKNLVLFLGDGMSIATLAATRIAELRGEEMVLSFESFPFSGQSRTYSVNTQVPDSASTATAYLTGVKTNYGVVGLNARVPRYDCEGQRDPANHTHSIARWAMDKGKWAGLVTTTTVTDATPAGVYAHVANRYWENNDEITKQDCDWRLLDDTAKQLVNGDGSRLKVVLGGGRNHFRSVGMPDEEDSPNKRTDGKDLIEEWLQSKGDAKKSFVWNATELMAVNGSETEYLLGLFEGTHCRYHLEVLEENIEHKEPSLAQMTQKAIEVLSKNEEGFFLFVEGGKIDKAHHEGVAHIAIDETAEFSKAVQTAYEMLLDRDDTLIVVTSDHSHLMTFAGYAYRSSTVFEFSSTHDVVYDGIPYTTLNYFDGPGFQNHINQTSGRRIDPTTLNTHDIHFLFPSTVPRNVVSHGGEDVPIYAYGPWSHLFTGVMEQNVIPYIMAYAACIGDGITMCDSNGQ